MTQESIQISDATQAALEADERLTVDQWAECMPHLSADELAEFYKRYTKNRDRKDTIDRLGLEVHSRKHLTKLTGARFVNGMLSDGQCHYQWQVTIL